MDVRIKINCDNSAFDEYPEMELARILNKLAMMVSDCGLKDQDVFKLWDINGNIVGKAEIIGEKENDEKND